MFLRSLRARLVALLLISLTLAALLFAALTARTFEHEQRVRSRQQLELQAAGFANAFRDISTLAYSSNNDLPPSFSRNFGSITAAEVTYEPIAALIDGPAPAGLSYRRPAPEIRAKLQPVRLAAGLTQTFETNVPGQGSVLSAAHSFSIASGKGKSTQVGTIIVSRPLSQLSSSTLTILEQIVPSLLLALAAAGALGVFLSRRISEPVHELSVASERIARGLYDIDLRSKGNDELGTLALRFEEMAQRLKQSSEAERSFLMRISHELRTPLTAIQGHVQAMSEGIIDDEEGRQSSFAVVLSECERLQRLIGDLLDLARLQAHAFKLNREHVDLAELCLQVVQTHREAARLRDIDLHEELHSSAAVIADGDRLVQVLSNLVANGIRASASGGSVQVHLHEVPGFVQISVADSGPGVPAARRDAIFRPFVTGEPGGTGLGLPISAELAYAMGATIGVGEAPGGGALFTIAFPDVLRIPATAVTSSS